MYNQDVYAEVIRIKKVIKDMPTEVCGELRRHYLHVPEAVYECSGIIVLGKRIKSFVFSTDLSIIKNINADAIFAVYPFTPQPVITQALLMASDIPVFTGVGGGITTGDHVVKLAMFAEMQGASGVVVNSPTPVEVIKKTSDAIDIPLVCTVTRNDGSFFEKINAGADIINVSAAADTPMVVAAIRRAYPKYPIIATGGPDNESILATIHAGANAITWTPPATSEILHDIMAAYRRGENYFDKENY